MVRRLLLLNGLAILGVIWFHAGGWGFTALLAWQGRYAAAVGPGFEPLGSAGYYALRIVEQTIVASIPAFLFVSGYFIAVAAGRTQKTVGWGVVGARIKNLLIPYLIWSVTLLALHYLQGYSHSATGYLMILATGKANPAYYYIILLGQFYLISPFLVPLARKRWPLLLVGSGIIQLAVQLLQYPVLLGLDWPALRPFVDAVPKWFFPVRIFWFSLGMVTGFHLQAIKAWADRTKSFWLVLLITSFFVGIFEFELYFRWSGLDWLNHRETLIDNIYCAAALMCFIAFDRFVFPFSKQLAELGAKSFGIYLVHSPVMEYTARAIYHLAPALLANQFLMQPILILMGLAISLAAMFVVERSPLRRYYSYLFG